MKSYPVTLFIKANVYIFQSCTWLLTLFPTSRFLKLKIRNFKGFFWSFFCIVQFSRFLLLSFSTAFIFYHIFSFLSSPFFKFFFKARFSTWCDVYLFYHVSFRLSSPFSRFFQSFLSDFSHGSRDSLFILPLSFTFVNRFWSSLYICISKTYQMIAFYSKIYIFRHYSGIKKSLRSFPADRRATALFNVPASKKAYI